MVKVLVGDKKEELLDTSGRFSSQQKLKKATAANVILLLKTRGSKFQNNFALSLG